MESHIAKIMTYQNTARQMWEKAEKFTCVPATIKASSNQETTKSIYL
jgi:hypothetical protein